MIYNWSVVTQQAINDLLRPRKAILPGYWYFPLKCIAVFGFLVLNIYN